MDHSGAKEIRALGGLALHGDSCSRGIRAPGDSCSRGDSCSTQDWFLFRFCHFFQKNVETGNPGEWCAKQFSWVFEDFRFMIHTPFSRFFLKKTQKYLWCPKISFMIHTPFSRIHDTYSVLQDSWYILRSPGFMIHTPFSRIHDTYSVLQDSWYILRSSGFCFMIRIWSKKGWNRVSYGEWAAKP